MITVILMYARIDAGLLRFGWFKFEIWGGGGGGETN